MTDIINAVPFGSDQALCSRDIWKKIDCWAEVTISNRLGFLASQGVIKRRQEPIASGFRYVYWREA